MDKIAVKGAIIKTILKRMGRTFDDMASSGKGADAVRKAGLTTREKLWNILHTEPLPIARRKRKLVDKIFDAKTPKARDKAHARVDNFERNQARVRRAGVGLGAADTAAGVKLSNDINEAYANVHHLDGGKRVKSNHPSEKTEKGFRGSPNVQKGLATAGGALAGLLGSKAYGAITGNKSTLRDILTTAAGGGTGYGTALYLQGKEASLGYLNGYQQKQADVIGEQAAGIPASALLGLIPGVGGASHTAPLVAGAMGEETTEKEIKDMNKATAKGAIPFVAPYRQGRRIRASFDRSKRINKGNSKALRNILGEQFGAITAIGIPTAIGAGIGSSIKGSIDGLDYNHTEEGALAGAGVGLAGILAAAALAASKKRRTPNEQAAHDAEGHSLSNYLVPGAGQYDAWKRLGSTGEQPKG